MSFLGDETREVSHTAVRLLLELVEREAGEDAVAEVLGRAGDTRPLAALLDDTGWSTYRQFRRLLEEAAQVLGGVDELEKIASLDLTGGSTPSSTEMLAMLGSPNVLFAEIAKGHSGLLSFLDTRGEQVGETEWVFDQVMKTGFEPFPEYCAYARGLFPMSPRLFGYDESHVVEERCQNRGDDVCRFRVSWVEVDETTRALTTADQRIQLLERRIDSFQATVAELVAADDLDTALNRVVSSAARAVKAPGFVLAIEPLPGIESSVYHHGLDASDAARIAEKLLAGEPCSEVERHVVAIESSRRRYGLLAAYDPDGIMFDELPTLQSYARLAATALDSASSLAEARLEATRAQALLSLAETLAEISTVEAMAFSLARAVPAVVGADYALVSLADDAGTTARIVACAGFTPAWEAEILGAEMPALENADQIMYLGPESTEELRPVVSETREVVRSLVTAQAASVVVPVVVDGQPAAWLTVGVTERAERLAPTPELEARLVGLAAQASTALRNTLLVEQIRHQALHDALTGLPNRALILDRASQMLARARRDGSPVGALFIDLDGFKEINDTLGHAAGDQLLRAVTTRLEATVRESDTLGRLGGDEFVVLVDCAHLDAGPGLVAERLLDVLREPFVLEGRDTTPLTVTASIGIANAGPRSSAGDLLRDADIALYQAKGAGKNRSVVFAPEMQTAVRDRLELEMDLRKALDAGQFFLVYQPIFDLRTSEITGAEALLRWDHPVRGVVQPATFIPLLEETGLIGAVGAWVLEEACRQTAEWHAAGHRIDVSVNVSARQLDSDRLIEDVRTALALADLPPTSLIVEVTETTIMRDAEATVRRLDLLKALGVRIAIDDFGTGYSSLAYLRQFPVDALKIDRSFINAIADSTEAAALIHTLVNLGKALGLATLAEGIEDDAQYARLRGEDCDSGQGFLLSRPLAADDLRTFLTQSGSLERFIA